MLNNTSEEVRLSGQRLLVYHIRILARVTSSGRAIPWSSSAVVNSTSSSFAPMKAILSSSADWSAAPCKSGLLPWAGAKHVLVILTGWVMGLSISTWVLPGANPCSSIFICCFPAGLIHCRQGFPSNWKRVRECPPHFEHQTTSPLVHNVCPSGSRFIASMILRVARCVHSLSLSTARVAAARWQS